MGYKIVVTVDAKVDMNNIIQYLLFEKQNLQAALNVLNDFETTKDNLKHIGGSLPFCANPRLQQLGYHRINFSKHNYFMLYRIVNDIICIDNIFHNLQDYENKVR